jgi:hypothetical protein
MLLLLILDRKEAMAEVILEVQVKEGRKKRAKGCNRGTILFIIRRVVALALLLQDQYNPSQ